MAWHGANRGTASQVCNTRVQGPPYGPVAGCLHPCRFYVTSLTVRLRFDKRLSCNCLMAVCSARPAICLSQCWTEPLLAAAAQVRVFYTAPTLIRSLMQSGDDWVKAHDRGSLRVLGTVGEPIGEHAWNWFGAPHHAARVIDCVSAGLCRNVGTGPRLICALV